MFCFLLNIYSGIGTETRFIEVYAFVSKERLDVIVKLINCSVSEHNLASFKLLKSKRVFPETKSSDPITMMMPAHIRS